MKAKERTRFSLSCHFGKVLVLSSILSDFLKRKHPDKTGRFTEVEAFIAGNLKQVTIDSITNHFNPVKRTVSITYPNKRETHHEKRKDMVKSLLKQDKDLVYISEITGFSVSYLKN